MNHGVDPPACLNVIKTGDNDAKLAEKFFVKLLNHIGVSVDLAAWHALHDEASSNVRLVLVDISATEKELSVQVGNIDLIEVNNIKGSCEC